MPKMTEITKKINRPLTDPLPPEELAVGVVAGGAIVGSVPFLIFRQVAISIIIEIH